MKTNPANILDKIEKINENLKAQEKEIDSLRKELVKLQGSNIEVEEVNGLKLIVQKFEGKSLEDLKQMVDNLKDKENNLVVVFANVSDDKINFVAGVTKDLTNKIKAGDIIKNLAELTDGRGGGRPDFAQGGGKSIEKLSEALEKVRNNIKSLI